MRRIWRRFINWLFSENKEMTNKEMARFIVDKALSDIYKENKESS